MARQKRHDKKGLKKRLSFILMIYMDGLSEQKKMKLKKYLENKLDNLVDYYVSLLNRKERKNLASELEDEYLITRLEELS